MPSMLTRPVDQVEENRHLQESNKENHLLSPATLKRPYDQIDGSADGPTIRNDEPPAKRQQMNGDTNTTANGVLTNGDYHHSTHKETTHTAPPIDQNDAPPELHHIQENIVPLSLIWERMAQEAHVELEELIADLANLPAPPINGYANPRNDVNVEKKNRIWDFAHKWRAKFIQLGVLTAWSTNAEAVGKLIDLSFWLTGQRTHHREFVSWMGELKRLLSFESLPPPDLKTALEVLSTGKANWVSHLGYIPQKPLSPKELLQSLKTLNTILTIRMTTQQEIPYHFSNWSVKNGRVTFRVKDEFELDLAIASEDPASQFYFIDLRFLFSPSSRFLPRGPAKAQIEWRINEILFRQGLQACYEYLHELILEYKITVLRDQARKMIRNQWSNNTRLCASNRGIVIHYWTTRPGKKNWIEIGVNSGRIRGKPPSDHETSFLNVRWHRHGVDVIDHGIEIDTARLSMERLLNEVIACHANYIFKGTKRKLKQHSIFSKFQLSVKHRAHPFNARDCSVTVQMSKQKTVSIILDAVTGMLEINPASRSSWSTMYHANNSPDLALHLANQLGILRCNMVLEDAVFEAIKFGWQVEPVRQLNQETKARLFKSDKIRYQFFYIPSWPMDWFLLAFTTTLEGDNIWLVEMQDKTWVPSAEDQITGRYQKFKSSIRLNPKGGAVQLLSLNNSRLVDLEKQSTTLLSQRQDAIWLRQQSSNGSSWSYQVAQSLASNAQLYIRHVKAAQANSTTSHNWCTNAIKICYVGLSLSRSDFVTFVTGQLRKPNAQIRAIAGQKHKSLIFSPFKNEFAFQIKTALGVPTLKVTDAKLDRLGSLIRFLDATEEYGFICQGLSLDRMSFTYSSAPAEILDPMAPLTMATTLAASISFPNATQMRISFSKGNPHLMIQDTLNQELNSPDGMSTVATLLRESLPLVQGLQAIQDLHPFASNGVQLRISPRSCTSFGVRYYNKTVRFQFDVTTRTQGELKMHALHAVATLHPGVALPKKVDIAPTSGVEDNSSNELLQPLQPLHPEDLQKLWDDLVKPRGAGWYNLAKGIVCELTSIEACLRHLDTAITEAFSRAADPEPGLLSSSETNQADSYANTSASTSPQKGKVGQSETQAKPIQAEDKKASAQLSQATNIKTPAATQPITQQPTPPRTSAVPVQGAPQANMAQSRVSPGSLPPNTLNRPVNMNFKPGLGQQLPAANAMAILQAQQKAAQNFNAPQANMAQMRPTVGTAPQANMQNKRPPGPTIPSPPKKPNNGQNKNQAITLD